MLPKNNLELLKDTDVVNIGPNGVKITAAVYRQSCLSNVSQDDIDRNINILLKAQNEKTNNWWLEHIEGQRKLVKALLSNTFYELYRDFERAERALDYKVDQIINLFKVVHNG